MIKLALINNRKSMIRFESTISLLRKLKRFLFLNCIIEDALINFRGGGYILIENAPKCRILCFRENPEHSLYKLVN